MPFINSSTRVKRQKRSKDRKINHKCTNAILFTTIKASSAEAKPSWHCPLSMSSCLASAIAVAIKPMDVASRTWFFMILIRDKWQQLQLLSLSLWQEEAEISGFYQSLLAQLLLDLLCALTVMLHISVLPSVLYQNPSGPRNRELSVNLPRHSPSWNSQWPSKSEPTGTACFFQSSVQFWTNQRPWFLRWLVNGVFEIHNAWMQAFPFNFPPPLRFISCNLPIFRAAKTRSLANLAGFLGFSFSKNAQERLLRRPTW